MNTYEDLQRRWEHAEANLTASNMELEKARARIVELEAALEDTQKEAMFMAQVWLSYRNEIDPIVDDIGGDADGIRFVADHIIEQDDARALLAKVQS